ncbi:MAG: ATP-dependent helicase [Anaerolineae bacterium]|nr:MAG: ATP-dependent helicase [Anaerolineae bacterium]WKZ42546.1 MAG: ATP-dependent helicase [Anaerolineales bacterium]
MNFTPRPSQQEILRYTGGRLGIAAVPGAGKTHILSALAAQIIQSDALQDDQEVLIVTLVNSAVDNFEARIKRFFDNPLHALYKYRVRTLHGLAHDIVREKPARVGLEERFSIIDEREAGFIRRESVNAWLANHSLDDYLDPALDQSKMDWVKRQQLPDLLDSLALAFIRSSKDRLLTPDSLRAKLDSSPAPLPLAELGYSIYADYQRALAYRGAVDFDDLIRLALTLLENDEEYLARLQYRYPFILEDEAQDSSLTQERILSLLSGSRAERRLSDSEAADEARLTGDPALRLRSSESARRSAQRGELGGNWVRVGDPNQAIFETFTTASPELLRAFIQNNPSIDMPESGRSQPSILALANHLIDWVMTSHPIPEARTALSVPHIVPVPVDDPQQNPPDNPEGIKFVSKRYTPDEELEAVVKSVKGYVDSIWDFPDDDKPTIAILVPRNQRGVDVVNALRQRGIEPIELISSTSETRAAAGSLSYLLAYLSDPSSARKLSKAYEVWRRDIFGSSKNVGKGLAPVQGVDDGSEEGDRKGRPYIEQIPALLRKMVDVENFVAPQKADDWLSAVRESEAGADQALIQELGEFRVVVQRWLSAVMLPIDQLTLTLAQDVFTEAHDLALAHKLALVLRKAADDHPDWRLPELTAELAVIAKNERRFIGFSSDDSGFDPERHRGRVVVTTMHKAKGLEWDRVYLMSVNNYDFPSAMPNDRFISEKWFVRSGLDLSAEALAQLSALWSRYAPPTNGGATRPSNDEYDWYEEGAATSRSRLDYVKERLRLFYVGITRAKRELIVTWNSGRQGDATPSLPLSELMGWRENQG